MKTNIHKNAKILKQIFSADKLDTRVLDHVLDTDKLLEIAKDGNDSLNKNEEIRAYTDMPSYPDPNGKTINSYICEITIAPTSNENGLRMSWFENSLEDINRDLLGLGLQEVKDLGKIYTVHKHGININIIVKYIMGEYDKRYESYSIPEIQSKFKEKLEEAIKKSSIKTNSYRRSNMIKSGLTAFDRAIEKKYNGTSPNGAGQYYLDWKYNLADEKDYIEQLADKNGLSVEFQTDEGYFEVFSSRRNNLKIQSKQYIKSGASAGYDITIEGIELDTSKVEILEQDDDSVQVNVPVKPCVVDRWVAESYYEGIDSNYNDSFFGNDDKRVDSGYVKMIIDIWENETAEDAIDAIPNVIDIKAQYGWGWVHPNLPEEGVHFKYKDIKEPDIGAYEEIHIDEIELNCPNICMDINAFFANPEDYYDEVYNSRKPVTSGLTFRQAVQDFKAAGQWNDYYEMQQDWEAYKDGLERDGMIPEKTRSTWGNPCTPEGFKKWNK